VIRLVIFIAGTFLVWLILLSVCHVCTVHQTLNGDSTLNSFWSHLGLQMCTVESSYSGCSESNDTTHTVLCIWGLTHESSTFWFWGIILHKLYSYAALHRLLRCAEAIFWRLVWGCNHGLCHCLYHFQPFFTTFSELYAKFCCTSALKWSLQPAKNVSCHVNWSVTEQYSWWQWFIAF
jgi:hypothetical protein